MKAAIKGGAKSPIFRLALSACILWLPIAGWLVYGRHIEAFTHLSGTELSEKQEIQCYVNGIPFAKPTAPSLSRPPMPREESDCLRETYFKNLESEAEWKNEINKESAIWFSKWGIALPLIFLALVAARKSIVGGLGVGITVTGAKTTKLFRCGGLR